jgi:hypothetical protein
VVATRRVKEGDPEGFAAAPQHLRGKLPLSQGPVDRCFLAVMAVQAWLRLRSRRFEEYPFTTFE